MKKLINYFTSIEWVGIAFVVTAIIGAFVLFSPIKSKEEVTVTVSEDTLIQFDTGIDIGDLVATFDYEQPRQFILQGEPRMVTPEAIIDFSGDKVTYSGDLPVDEAAKIFFNAVMGFVQEARECKNESK